MTERWNHASSKKDDIINFIKKKKKMQKGWRTKEQKLLFHYRISRWTTCLEMGVICFQVRKQPVFGKISTPIIKLVFI